MSTAGVGPLCFLKTNVTAPVYQYILEHFMLPSADQLFKDADFIFQQDLAPAHTAKSTKSWLNDRGVGVLDWPANSPDLNIERIYGILSRETRDQKMQMSRRLLPKKPGLPYIYIHSFSRRFYPKRLTIEEYNKRYIIKRQTDIGIACNIMYRQCSEQNLARQWEVKLKRAKVRKESGGASF